MEFRHLTDAGTTPRRPKMNQCPIPLKILDADLRAVDEGEREVGNRVSGSDTALRVKQLSIRIELGKIGVVSLEAINKSASKITFAGTVRAEHHVCKGLAFDESVGVGLEHQLKALSRGMGVVEWINSSREDLEELIRGEAPERGIERCDFEDLRWCHFGDTSERGRSPTGSESLDHREGPYARVGSYGLGHLLVGTHVDTLVTPPLEDRVG
jgi:hypothetical protein